MNRLAILVGFLGLLGLLPFVIGDYGAVLAPNVGDTTYGDQALLPQPSPYVSGWLNNQKFPASGFCFNETEGRVLKNFSNPLYDMPIIISTEGGPGMPMVWAWIMKILLQEQIGYQAAWYDQGDTTITFYDRLVKNLPSKRSDIEIQSYQLSSDPTTDFKKYVQGDGTVTSHGSQSQTSQGGIYVSAAAMMLHPEFAVDSYRAFAAGPNILGEYPLYGAVSDNPMLRLFINDSWQVVDELKSVFGFANYFTENPFSFDPILGHGPTCQPEMTSLSAARTAIVVNSSLSTSGECWQRSSSGH